MEVAVLMKCSLEQMLELQSLLSGVTQTRAVLVPSESGDYPFSLSRCDLLQWFGTAWISFFNKGISNMQNFSRIEGFGKSSATKGLFHCELVLFVRKHSSIDLLFCSILGMLPLQRFIFRCHAFSPSPLGARKALQYVPMRHFKSDK